MRVFILIYPDCERGELGGSFGAYIHQLRSWDQLPYRRLLNRFALLAMCIHPVE